MSQKVKQDTEKSDKPSTTVREKETKASAAPAAPGGVGEREGGGRDGGGVGSGEADLGRGDLDQGDQKYYGKKKGTCGKASARVVALL